MAPEDRPLTEKEYAEFKRQVNYAQEQAALEDIAELLAVQDKKIKDQNIYIKVLEDLAVSRQGKLDRLEKVLETLEQEVLKLR